MGDLNTISTLDKPLYNGTLLCGNGTFNPGEHNRERVTNISLKGDGNYYLDFSPMETLMIKTDLVNLCYFSEGFYDVMPTLRLKNATSAF